MGSICLSSASILRCDSLTLNQYIYLIIPTALEIIFSTALVFIDQGPGKRNLLLTAEGLSFLTLAVLELVSQILPAVRGNLRFFNAFDLAIGIASLLPISLYTTFLFLLTNAEIVSALPRRIKNPTIFASILFILVIVVFNEIAAFTGISIRNLPTDNTPKTIVEVGSSGSTEQQLWTFSTSLTLAFLTGFQIAIFCFAFFRLMQTIFSHRRFDSRPGAKSQLIKGIGWISGSLMLGGIETVIGFVVGGFGVVLSRRILRLLTRAALCIGVIKGVDDFYVRSQFHEIISNPRISTFRQLSPKATSFHAAAQAFDAHDASDSDVHEASDASDVHKESEVHREPDAHQESDAHQEPESATYKAPPTPELPDMAHFASIREKAYQRVGVRYNRGTPSLHLRFSNLDIPSPATIAEVLKSRPQSEWELPQPSFFQPLKSVFRNSSDSTSSFFAPFELVSTPRRTLSQRSARAKLYQAALPATSEESAISESTNAVEPQDLSRVQSMKSLPDSLQAVQELAGQFPGPPMAFKDGNTFRMARASVIGTLPIPQAFGSPLELPLNEPSSQEGLVPDDNEWSCNISSLLVLSDDRSMRPTRQPTLYNVTGSPPKLASLYPEKSFDPFNDNKEEEDPLSSSRTAIAKTISRPVNSMSQDVEAGTGDMGTALNTGKRSRQPRPPRRPRYQKTKSKDIPLSRTSIGEDPSKSTSSPRHTNLKRGNVQLKDIIIPPRRSNMPEILGEYEESRDDINARSGRGV